MSENFVFDSAAAMERVDQDRELLQELCEMFAADNARAMAELAQSLESRNLSAAASQAHAIKSALGNLGAMLAYQSARDLEISAKENDLAASKLAFASMSRATDQFLTAYKSFFSA